MRPRALRPLLVSAATLAALSACETTGDPNQGGLFGWSESRRRRARLPCTPLSNSRKAALHPRDRKHPALQATRSRNAATIQQQRASLNRMLTQLDEVDRAGGSGRTAALRSRISETRSDSSLDDSEMRSRVNALDSEVRSLRKEYGLLLQR